MNDLAHVYCVIGDPVEHSVSPQIHDYIYRILNLDLQYDAVRVPSDLLPQFIQETRGRGRPGFNVSIPHKERIIHHLDEVDPMARRAGAVNTVKNQRGRLKGFNTDIEGCLEALKHEEWEPEGVCALLGAGGAARAAIGALAALGFHRIILMNRSIERAEKLKKDFQNLNSLTMSVHALHEKKINQLLKDVRLIINATPVGMWPHVDAMPIHRLDFITPETTVFDMVPRPFQTRLLKEAKSRGAKIISGLRMLIGQAIAADEIWLNRKCPETIHEDLYHTMIQRMEKDG